MTVLDRLREVCLQLEGVEERLSHGSPAFFAHGRQFVHYWENHHDDGMVAIWCAAPMGMQETLVAAAPERFFVPPYVGGRGWLGLRLDRSPDWAEVAHVVGHAHRVVTLAASGRR
jgi:hypothetical protein